MIFYNVERRHQQPIMPVDILKNPVIDLMLLNILNYLITISINWLLTQILNDSVKSGYVMLIANIFTAGFTYPITII